MKHAANRKLTIDIEAPSNSESQEQMPILPEERFMERQFESFLQNKKPKKDITESKP